MIVKGLILYNFDYCMFLLDTFSVVSEPGKEVSLVLQWPAQILSDLLQEPFYLVLV